MRRRFSGGAPTNRRRTADTISSRSRLLSSLSTFSAPLAPLGSLLLGDVRPIVRRLVGIERFLRRANLVGHVLQVEADARPGVEASAHRIDEDVGRLEVGGCLGVSRLPPLESRQRVILFLRARDLDERLGRRPAPRRLHARRLARLLLIVRRPWRVALTVALLARRQLE